MDGFFPSPRSQVRSANCFDFSYDHELKIQRAQENARRAGKEKEIERYADLITDLQVRPFVVIRKSLKRKSRLFLFRINRWLKNVGRANCDVESANSITRASFTKLFKRKITNSRLKTFVSTKISFRIVFSFQTNDRSPTPTPRIAQRDQTKGSTNETFCQG